MFLFFFLISPRCSYVLINWLIKHRLEESRPNGEKMKICETFAKWPTCTGAPCWHTAWPTARFLRQPIHSSHHDDFLWSSCKCAFLSVHVRSWWVLCIALLPGEGPLSSFIERHCLWPWTAIQFGYDCRHYMPRGFPLVGIRAYNARLYISRIWKLEYFRNSWDDFPCHWRLRHCLI